MASKAGKMHGRVEGAANCCAVPGCRHPGEFRAPLTTSPELQKVIAALRTVVATLEEDRYMAPDLAAAASFVSSGALAASVSKGILPVLEA